MDRSGQKARPGGQSVVHSIESPFAIMGLSPLVALCVLAAVTGCDSRSPQAASGPAQPQIAFAEARTAASRPTSPIGNLSATDFVAEPQVDPAEQTAGPRRIVSMAPNLTEMTFAFGLGDRLVGRTQYCLYPPQAVGVDVVGAHLDPNIERILALQPDLVLVTGIRSVLVEKFEAVKLPVHALPDSSLEDVFRSIEQFGRLTDRPRTAATLVSRMRGEMSRLQRAAARLAGDRTLKALFVTGALPSAARNIWVAGPGGHLDTMLAMAGVRNTAGQVANKAWMEITPEQVVWQQPDVIVEVREPAEMPLRAEAVAAWRRLPGLKDTKIVTLDEPAMLVPGPRINLMLAKLIAGLYGEGGLGDTATRQLSGTKPATVGGNAD